MKNLYILLFAILCFSCKNDSKEAKVDTKETSAKEEKTNAARNLAETIATTHHKKDFFDNGAIAFDININFGGEERLNGRVTMLTNSSKIKIEKEDGTTIVYNGEEVFLYPEQKNYEGARFDIFTWPYFFAMPFKLTDDGTKWQEKQERKLDSTNYNSAKLTFKNNVGDAPDDWYIIYSDKRTHLLKAAAYIVTFGKDVKSAEENPHAIVYERYFTVKSVPVAKYWKFYNWSEDKGIYGEAIGDAEISKLKYIPIEEATFDIPQNAIKVER
ncbi:hypothetical protein [Mesonia aestuariivivens]|uniref:Heat-shock protein Hsp90 n=1 Tax=Mesonia aestuariivivens TaxID=2796128 RepID=A0ABS6W2C1_9FLAO|nr:hypothetical protein [Mesonia aestuariivivens]MBW2962001.1 hypothetical protein [Mesonia aestuariivivens]